MADANDNDPDVALTGPPQRGRGVHGQYVYWICMQHPKPETVQRTGVKTPADFDRITFRDMLVQSHQECGIEIEETTCFKEPNENGLFHLNLLARSRSQFKWLAVARNILTKHRVHVMFVLCVQTAGQPAQQAPDASFAEANQRMHAGRNDFYAKAQDNCNKHPHKLHILQ